MSKNFLKKILEILNKNVTDREFSEDMVFTAVKNAVDPARLITNLAEVLRISEKETEEILSGGGFDDIVAQKYLTKSSDGSNEKQTKYFISKSESDYPFKNLFSAEFFPKLEEPILLGESEAQAFENLVTSIKNDHAIHPFADMFRGDVMKYHDEFINGDAKKIDAYISENFPNGHPKYLLTSGIGGNEMSNHYIAQINNLNPKKKILWQVIDAPKQLDQLPEDANLENTLFMEFSRSGKTEETVKIHEFTPRELKRIVFSNRGPLHEIGKRDNNLVLDLPDEVAGRFGRNKTPIILAPMHVARMDTKSYWKLIEKAIEAFDFDKENSLPMQIAQYIRIFQRKNGINHIYLGILGRKLYPLANELLQFWDESIAKNQNDISMAKYLGLPRDSHTIMEGILANAKTKMGIYMVQDDMFPEKLPPFGQEMIDPINPKHAGLRFGDDEKILAEANIQRFAEIMPTIKITVKGKPSWEHSAVIGQLWSDITYAYARLCNIDPGSNPEVKFVRDRSAKLLAEGL